MDSQPEPDHILQLEPHARAADRRADSSQLLPGWLHEGEDRDLLVDCREVWRCPLQLLAPSRVRSGTRKRTRHNRSPGTYPQQKALPCSSAPVHVVRFDLLSSSQLPVMALASPST